MKSTEKADSAQTPPGKSFIAAARAARKVLRDRFARLLAITKVDGGNQKSRVILFIILFLLFLLVSTLGHGYICKHHEEPRYRPSPAESFYWTVATASTLGSYTGEVELSSELGLLFTAFVVVMGICFIFLGVPLFFIPWMEKRFRRIIRPREPDIPGEGHVIVCGFSRTTQAVIRELEEGEHSFVVIADFKRLDQPLPLQHGYPIIDGDAGMSASLERAGVLTASSVILLESDERNVFISLSCRRLNPELHIVAIARDIRNIHILKKAKANKVISPKMIEGVMLGRRALKEHDMDISGELSVTGMKIFQYVVTSDSPLDGKDIRSTMLWWFGIILVGLWHEGRFRTMPPVETIFHTDDILIMLGKEESIVNFRGYCKGDVT